MKYLARLIHSGRKFSHIDGFYTALPNLSNIFNLVALTDSYGKKMLRAALAKKKPPEYEEKEKHFDPFDWDEDDPFGVNEDNASDSDSNVS